jgi:hypothetical protein
MPATWKGFKEEVLFCLKPVFSKPCHMYTPISSNFAKRHAGYSQIGEEVSELGQRREM